MQKQEIKELICDVCHKMWQLGWVAANDGNISVKMEHLLDHSIGNQQKFYYAGKADTRQ